MIQLDDDGGGDADCLFVNAGLKVCLTGDSPAVATLRQAAANRSSPYKS